MHMDFRMEVKQIQPVKLYYHLHKLSVYCLYLIARMDETKCHGFVAIKKIFMWTNKLSHQRAWGKSWFVCLSEARVSGEGNIIPCKTSTYHLSLTALGLYFVL